jgi:hypothetical protein
MSHFKEFLGAKEMFVVDGRVYEIRREDIPALVLLLQEYVEAFGELLENVPNE